MITNLHIMILNHNMDDIPATMQCMFNNKNKQLFFQKYRLHLLFLFMCVYKISFKNPRTFSYYFEFYFVSILSQ